MQIPPLSVTPILTCPKWYLLGTCWRGYNSGGCRVCLCKFVCSFAFFARVPKFLAKWPAKIKRLAQKKCDKKSQETLQPHKLYNFALFACHQPWAQSTWRIPSLSHFLSRPLLPVAKQTRQPCLYLSIYLSIYVSMYLSIKISISHCALLRIIWGPCLHPKLFSFPRSY